MTTAETRSSPAALDDIFHPRSVAVVGASRDIKKRGYEYLQWLVGGGFRGSIYPINPQTRELYGLPTYPSLGAVPGPVELAIIALPAFSVAQALKECQAKGVKAAIIIASGFGEAGEAGIQRQQEVLTIARQGGLRLLGPNTTGILNPAARFTSTWNPLKGVKGGTVAFIAQTGMFAGNMLQWILSAERFGISKVAGLGNKIDVAEPEVLEYLARDPETRVIMIYMEGVADGRRFFQAARQVAAHKPILLLKGGRTEAGARTALSHTGSLASRTEVLEACLRQAGVLSVRHLEEMLDLAKVLAYQPLPRGPRMALCSMSGGAAVMAADAFVEAGLSLAQLQPATLEKIAQNIPAWARPTHPLDLEPLSEKVGRVEAYRLGLELCLADPGVDGALLSIAGIEADLEVAKVVVPVIRSFPGKPVAVAVLGSRPVYDELFNSFEDAQAPVYLTTPRAARALAALWKYRQQRDRHV